MKITQVRSVAAWCPRKRASHTALGVATLSEHTVVFVETDAGITGVGEVSSVFRRRGMLLKNELDRHLAPAVIGEDPFAIARLNARLEAALDGAQEAKAGIEMALWDIKGKALGAPIYELLGGKVRERVPLSFSIPFGAPDEMAAFARERVRAGHRTIKVKVGSGDTARDVATVGAVRAAIGPHIKLRVDGNMGWPDAKTSIAAIRQMLPYGLELVEQPIAAHDLAGMAEVRRALDVPLMADESVRDPSSAMRMLRAGAADVANIYVSESGGLLNAWHISAMCEAAGVPCMIGSMPEFGIGTAAQIHLAIAMSNLGPDSDTCGVLYHDDDLLSVPLRIEDGFAYPPEGPGLGVEIDIAKLDTWNKRALAIDATRPGGWKEGP